MTIESEEFRKLMRSYGSAYMNYFLRTEDATQPSAELSEVVAHIDAKMRERDLKLIEATIMLCGACCTHATVLKLEAIDPQSIIDEVDKS